MKYKLTPIAAGLAVAMFVLIAGWFIDRSEEQKAIAQQKLLVHEQLTTARALLEHSLDERLSLASGLVAYVKSIRDPEHIATKDFEIFARNLAGDITGIRSLQLAQDVVVSHVYPLKGNEAALGHDLLADPARRGAVLEALNDKELILAGPVELKQGGTGLIGRIPIILNKDETGEKTDSLWGLAIVLLDYDAIINEAGIKSQTGGISYAVRGKDGLGAAGENFFGDEQVFLNEPQISDISLPHGSWQVGATALDGWGSMTPDRWLFRVSTLIFSIVAGLLIWILLRHPNKLVEEIEKATRLLKQSEDRYIAIWENSPLGIFLSDSGGKVIMANPAFSQLTGYSEKELIGKKYFDLTAPDHLARESKLKHDQGFNTAKGRGGLKDLSVTMEEGTITRKDGVQRSVQFDEYYLYEKGEPKFKVTLMSDITDQKQTQIKLLEERSKAQEYLNVAAVIIVALDTKGRLTMINSKGCETTGYSLLDIIGKNWFDTFIPENSREKFRNIFSSILAGTSGEATRTIDTPFLTKQGDERQIKWHVTLLKEENGHVTAKGILASGEDVTEIRKAEQETRKLLQAIEQAAESICILDTDGSMKYVNPAFEKSTGYSKEELTKENFRILNNDKHPKEFYDSIWQELSKGNVWSGFMFNKRKNGSLYEEEIVITPVKGEDGSIISYIGVGRDVTYEKQIELQLRQSQKLEAIGRLAGGIAHDFNNQLTAISGYADLLLLKMPEGELRDDALEIIKASQRAATLTGQLLAFSRKQTMNIKSLSINSIIDDIEKMLQRLISEDIRLSTVLEPDLMCIKADPNQIEQLLFNLVINSRDAMPAGGKITLETANVELDVERLRGFPNFEPGSYVMLAVSDTGIGMDEETKSHLFEPFYTTKDVGKGTGLGLPTVYGIVEQSEGFIKVISEINEGTTFRLYFKPCGDATSEDIVLPTSPTEMPRGSERILLIEDDSSVRDLAQTILKRQGYLVITATSGKSALEMLEAKPDILPELAMVISDVVMPEVNGKELVEMLRNKRPDLRVIFISGFTADIISPSGVLDNITVFVQKPFSAADLSQAVRDLLDKEI